MTLSWKKLSAPLAIIILFALAKLGPGDVNAAGVDCAADTAVPAFLSEGGMDPNLLLLIDNSASMYDLAYVDDQKYCFDDSFDENTNYAGYFDRGTWYYYDFTTSQFKETGSWSEAHTIWSSAIKEEVYHRPGVVHYGLDDIEGDGDGIMDFVSVIMATGNFLNWVMASKMDIEKEILTGGKFETTGTYGAPNDRLVMESRGCLNSRLVKQIALDTQCTENGDTGSCQLTMAVRPPQEPEYDEWQAGVNYAIGDKVKDLGMIWRAVGTTGPSTGTNVEDDTGTIWQQFSPWAAGTYYPANSIVKSQKGTLYITANGGTAAGSSLVEDTQINDWVQYNVTQIEIMPTTLTGYDNTACAEAIEGIQSGSLGLGTLKGKISDCMGYNNPNQTPIQHSNGAFSQAIQTCWWINQHGMSEEDKVLHVQSLQNQCEGIYGENIDPWDITTDYLGYVCYGVWDSDQDQQQGYIGRCWSPGEGAEKVCSHWWNPNKCAPFVKPDPECCKDWEYIGGTDPGWDAAGYDSIDDCVATAIQDYCGTMEVTEVVDPTDQASDTEEFWNIPAVLIDSGVLAQVGEPLGVMDGFIEQQGDPPEGLLQEFVGDIRTGAMTFNFDGSATECYEVNQISTIDYTCDDPGIRDGGKVITEIGKSASHTIELVNALNGIKATSWTPMAESIFNAIGYYTQRDDMRLHDDDFPIGEGHSPITDWCQANNILIITDGASTADLNSTVSTFVSLEGQSDADEMDFVNNDPSDPVACGGLYGSTLMDDLTYYGRRGEDIFLQGEEVEFKNQNIATHIVVAGSQRSTGEDECSPDVALAAAAYGGGTSLYQASDPSELETQLRAAFAAIRGGAASASAATVISSSRWGEGAVYQAIFWSSRERPGEEENDIEWIGEVHALFIDSKGNMYEDTNHDHKLDPYIDSNNNNILDGDEYGDRNVVLYYNEGSSATMGCYGQLDEYGICIGESVPFDKVNYLWSAADWLSEIPPARGYTWTDILYNRESIHPDESNYYDYLSYQKKRMIFTWIDFNNDGVVDRDPENAGNDEMQDFIPHEDTGEEDYWSTRVTLADPPDSSSRGPVPLDFGVATDDEVNEIIKYVRGLDDNASDPYDYTEYTNLRSRRWTVYNEEGSPETVTWRLGDVVHSTPTAVTRPVEAYYLIYSDITYARFVAEYTNRRHMIYFGANDGMLHAVNGGFYNSALKKFCISKDCNYEMEYDAPALGAEMWAYVPYNMLPHLKCLMDPLYEGNRHKYFVDLRPRIFDVQIWPVKYLGDEDYDGVHVGGWGTILVGGMRFGGSKLYPDVFDVDGTAGADYPHDNRIFTSAYFVFDITDPERPPELLGEFTQYGGGVDLGYTTVIPTAVPMKAGPEENDPTKWYLILGSGPTEINGESNQQGKIAVIDLEQMMSTRSFRIPDAVPTVANNEAGTFTIPDANSFISDPVTVDFELKKDYMADVVYFGTVSGAFDSSWRGKLYRLVTKDLDASGNQVLTAPSDWNDLLDDLTEPLTNPNVLIDAQRPITGAATVGTDGKNYWVYFGTGRFFSAEDKDDPGIPEGGGGNAIQKIYGIKEPRVCTNSGPVYEYFTWEEVEEAPTASFGHNTEPGKQGLQRVDQIQVADANFPDQAALTCQDNTTSCLPDSGAVDNYQELIDYIAGTGKKTCGADASDSTGTDGWYRLLTQDLERNLAQGALLGWILTISTYQPYEDPCLSEGLGNVYGLYYRTGTSWYEGLFKTHPEDTGLDENGNVLDHISTGRGLVMSPSLHVGEEEGTKAFIQSSTGEIFEIPQLNPPSNIKSGGATWKVIPAEDIRNATPLSGE